MGDVVLSCAICLSDLPDLDSYLILWDITRLDLYDRNVHRIPRIWRGKVDEYSVQQNHPCDT